MVLEQPFRTDLGVSENSVPHCTQWLIIIIPMKNGYFIGNIPHFQTKPYQEEQDIDFAAFATSDVTNSQFFFP